MEILAMFDFFDPLAKYVEIDLVEGGIDCYFGYGFLLCAWILFHYGVRVFVAMKTKRGKE